jgi:hypothetical protein
MRLSMKTLRLSMKTLRLLMKTMRLSMKTLRLLMKTMRLLTKTIALLTTAYIGTYDYLYDLMIRDFQQINYPILWGGRLAIGVNLSLGEWNSRLHKQSPPTRTKRKLMF